MKKTLSFSAWILPLLILLYWVITSSIHSYATIEEAIISEGKNVNSILYLEKTDSGTIVFYTIANDKQSWVGAGLVKENYFGWHWVNGGLYSSDIKQDLYSNYLPSISLLYGEIKNGKVDEIKVANGKIYDAKIIKANGTLLWFVYPLRVEGKYIDIKANSNPPIDMRYEL
ncbi:hypothetical protein [Paenibacillus alba]|uniref:DUF5590 domain-containing protein n=1 Tax=Paenibacillus alba TaxID=1197127 RepID=A0ABU6G5B1_9BACL|nr:hypothetical protein [Paenibacillus alba]MEC0229367.1 hypothetical protein [Paenibacillus alba]